nr:O-antigen ligase family protein [Caulobacter sp. 17J80-11]
MTGAAVLAPALAWLSPLGFLPLAVVAGLLCLHLWRKPPAPPWALVLLLVALAVWAAVAGLGSPPKEAGLLAGFADLERRSPLKLLLEVVVFMPLVLAARSLDPRSAERAARVLTVGAVALGVVLLVEGVSGAALYRAFALAIGEADRPDLMQRHAAQSGYVLALMYWPAAAFLLRERQKRMLVVLTAGVVVPAILLHAAAPVLALVLSTAAFVLVRSTGRAGATALAIAAGLFVAVAPLLVHLADLAGLTGSAKVGAPASWAARLDIWTFAAERVSERPFLGWGLDASRTFRPYLILHPHDAAIQIWLELGAVGAALVSLLWVWIFRASGDVLPADRTMCGAACAAAIVYFVIGALSFGVWQEWWVALGALTAAWTLTVGRVRAAPLPPRLRQEVLETVR